MKAVSIRQKLWLVLIATLAALAAIKGSFEYFQQRTQLALDARQNLHQLDAQFATLRQAQKDFLASKDLTHDTQFAETREQFREIYQQLQQQLSALNLNSDALARVDTELEAYALSFNGIVERQKAIGLDHTDGLYGALRQRAHDVEAVVTDHPELMAALLMLRRHEKDFMLRRLDQYPARFMSGLSTFRGLLFMSSIDNATLAGAQKALRHYTDAFETLVQNEREIGLDPNSGLLGGMQQRVSETETALQALKASLSDRIQANLRRSDFLSSIVVLSMMALISSILLWLLRDLGRSLARAGESAQALASGDWQTPIRARRHDEVGKLLHTLETMRTALVQKTDALEADGRLKGELTDLAAVIRGKTTLETLSDAIIRYVIPVLNGHVGAIYAANDRALEFLAGYGLAEKSVTKTISFGEGLTGQCAMEGCIIRVDQVPSDYLRIMSGTGSSEPGTVIAAPLVWQGTLYGVIEIGALGKLSGHAETFLDAAGEAIAIAINSCRVSDEMQRLLQDSLDKSDALEAEKQSAQRANEELALKAEQLQASEEELRVQQEELQAQAEELRVTNEELEAQTRLLQERSRELQRKLGSTI